MTIPILFSGLCITLVCAGWSAWQRGYYAVGLLGAMPGVAGLVVMWQGVG